MHSINMNANPGHPPPPPPPPPRIASLPESWRTSVPRVLMGPSLGTIPHMPMGTFTISPLRFHPRQRRRGRLPFCPRTNRGQLVSPLDRPHAPRRGVMPPCYDSGRSQHHNSRRQHWRSQHVHADEPHYGVYREDVISKWKNLRCLLYQVLALATATPTQVSMVALYRYPGYKRKNCFVSV